MVEHGVPEWAFAREGVAVELFEDKGLGGFDHCVSGVAGEVGAEVADEGPAGPGAPASLVTAGLSEAAGVVLEVNAGIADEDVGRGVGEEPGHGGVGHGPFGEDGVLGGEVGPHGAVEAEDGAGGEAALPELVAVGEGGEVEGGVAGFAVGI